MPSITRQRTVGATPQQVWDVISDPHQLPRWWPKLARVEGATATAWTMVLTTPRGRSVRADYMRTDRRENSLFAWRQELEGSPFERVFAAATTTIELSPDGGGTRVALTADERLRGRFRLGGFMVRSAARRRLDEALEGLERLFAPTTS